jgi:hypothetical protein
MSAIYARLASIKEYAAQAVNQAALSDVSQLAGNMHDALNASTLQQCYTALCEIVKKAPLYYDRTDDSMVLSTANGIMSRVKKENTLLFGEACKYNETMDLYLRVFALDKDFQADFFMRYIFNNELYAKQATQKLMYELPCYVAILVLAKCTRLLSSVSKDVPNLTLSELYCFNSKKERSLCIHMAFVPQGEPVNLTLGQEELVSKLSGSAKTILIKRQFLCQRPYFERIERAIKAGWQSGEETYREITGRRGCLKKNEFWVLLFICGGYGVGVGLYSFYQDAYCFPHEKRFDDNFGVKK